MVWEEIVGGRREEGGGRRGVEEFLFRAKVACLSRSSCGLVRFKQELRFSPKYNVLHYCSIITLLMDSAINILSHFR